MQHKDASQDVNNNSFKFGIVCISNRLSQFDFKASFCKMHFYYEILNIVNPKKKLVGGAPQHVKRAEMLY